MSEADRQSVSTTKRAERLKALKDVGVPSADEVAPPTHWPTLSPAEVQVKFPQLRDWVESLRTRYEDDMDVHVVPICWYQHPSIVAALQALRDHERSSYGTVSPASAGTDWHRAYRDITALLREFTAKAGCGAEHRPPNRIASTNDVEFAEFVMNEVAARRDRAVAIASSDVDWMEHVDEWGEIHLDGEGAGQ